MKSTKTILTACIASIVLLFNAGTIFAQGWVGTAGTTLHTVNSGLTPTPVNVGIGTATPGVELEIVKPGSFFQTYVLMHNNSNSHLQLVSGNGNGTHGGGPSGNTLIDFRQGRDLIFSSSLNNSLNGILPWMTIKGDNGNVGIGTVNPQRKLHTMGTLRFQNLLVGPTLTNLLVVDANGDVFTRDFSTFLNQVPPNSWNLAGNSNAVAGDFVGTTNNVRLDFRTSNTVKMTIKDGTQALVGIGTVSPAYNLDIRETSGPTFDAYLMMHNNHNSHLQILSGNEKWTGTSNPHGHGWEGASMIHFRDNHDFVISSSGNTNLQPNSTVYERLVINGLNGNTGIGVKDPLARLHTDGALIFANMPPSSTMTKLLVTDVNGNIATRDFSTFGGSSGTAWDLIGNTANPGDFIGTLNPYQLDLATNNVVKMTIDAGPSARVGIGTQSPSVNLEVVEPDQHRSSQALLHNTYSSHLQFLSGDDTKIILGNPHGTGWESAAMVNFQEDHDFVITSSPTTTLGSGMGVIDRLTIKGDNGNVGIDIIDPRARLEIRGENTNQFHPAMFVRDFNMNPLLYVGNDGHVGVGTTMPMSFGLVSNEKFTVMGDAYASGGIFQNSDRSYKKDITLISDALSKINQISGYTYAYRTDEFPGMSFPQDRRAGVIAQEIKTILPEAVKDLKDGHMAVNYDALIPLLIEGMKEQQKQIEQLKSAAPATASTTGIMAELELQKQKNAELAGKLIELESRISCNPCTGQLAPSTLTEKAALFQNAPNPFGEETSISYFLPQGSINAAISISNASGAEVKNITLTEKGNGRVILNLSGLNAGTYFYTLVVDGKRIDTKSMLVVKN
jgi:hypothetical protein